MKQLVVTLVLLLLSFTVLAQDDGIEEYNDKAPAEVEIWQGIQARSKQHDDVVVLQSSDIGDILGSSIPFIDTFIGPLADQLEEVEIHRGDHGITMDLKLLEGLKFPVKKQKSTSKGEILRVEVDKKVSLTFRNEAYKIRFHRIKGLGVVIKMPAVLRISGLTTQRLDLRAVHIDLRKQKLKFMVAAAGRLLKITATVDLKDEKFEGVNIWETLALNGPVLVALLRMF